MKAKKEDYDVTFGYKAVITVTVSASSEEEARTLATKEFQRQRGVNSPLVLQDDHFVIAGVTNLDQSWGMLP